MAEAPAAVAVEQQRLPPRRSRWFRHRRLVMGAAVLVLLIGYLAWRALTSGHESTDDAQVAADIVPLAVRVSAPVAQVLFHENDAVTAGQLLLVLDDSDLSSRARQGEADLESAEAAAEAAEAQVRVAEASALGTFSSAEAQVSGSASAVQNARALVIAARAAVSRAEAALRKATTDLHRARMLVAAHAVPQQQLDDARASFDSARGTLQQARAEVQAEEDAWRSALDRVREAEGRLNVSRPVEATIAAAQANARLSAAKANSAAAQLDYDMQQLSYARIFAPADGKLSTLTVHPGQLLEPGQIFVNLVPHKTYVVANFKETQLAHMRAGQRATVRVDTYGRRTFDAYVESLSGGTGAAFSLLPPDNATGNFVKVVQRVPVRLAWVKPPDVPLAAGLSVTATVDENAPRLELPGAEPACPVRGASLQRRDPAALSEPGQDERPQPEILAPGPRLVVTLAVIAATLMEVLDTSIVNVALPHMQGELGATLDEIGWVATAYIMSNVVVLPLTGWLSNVFGRRRYLGYSVILFTLASIGCGASRSLGTLVTFRVLQGVGGAAFLSTAQATLIEIYPAHLQGFAQAMFGIGVVMAPTLGPSLGGLLTDRYSWPYIFFINVPVGVVSAILTFLHVPDSRHANEAGRADFLGIGLLVMALAPLQVVLERGQRENWFASDLISWCTAASVAGVVLFIAWELHPRNRNPAVDLRVLTNRNLAAGCVSGVCLGLVLYGTVFALPQFFQNLQDHSAEQTGVLLIPGGVATALMMPVVGQLANRVDLRLLIGSGMVLVVVSMFMFSNRFTYGSPDSAFFWPLILRGAGLGLQFVPLSLASMGTLMPRKVAAGAGLYNLCRQLGGSFGIAILATMLDRRSRFHYDRLAESITASGVLTQERLARLRAGLAPHGIVSAQARLTSLRMLAGTVLREAALGAYQDVFLLSAAAGVGALLLLVLFKKPRVSSGATVH